jgi:hypothetical protein
MSDPSVKKDNIILLEDVLISRVSLAQPFKPKTPQIDSRTGQPKADKYHVDVILDEQHRQFAELMALIQNVAADGWQDRAQQILASIRGNKQRFCIQRGDLQRPGKPQYAGKIYVSASNEMQPTVGFTKNGVNVFNRRTPVMAVPSDDQYPYDGSFCNVHLQFYTYLFGNDPGMGSSVLGVQFNRHGQRLTRSRVSSGKEFGLVLGEADKAPPAAAAAKGDSLI